MPVFGYGCHGIGWLTSTESKFICNLDSELKDIKALEDTVVF